MGPRSPSEALDTTAHISPLAEPSGMSVGTCVGVGLRVGAGVGTGYD